MPKLKVYTKRDKAAFLNKCKSKGINISTDEITQSKDKKYFIVELDFQDAIKIKKLFNNNPHFKIVTSLQEIIQQDAWSHCPSLLYLLIK